MLFGLRLGLTQRAKASCREPADSYILMYSRNPTAVPLLYAPTEQALYNICSNTSTRLSMLQSLQLQMPFSSSVHQGLAAAALHSDHDSMEQCGYVKIHAQEPIMFVI